MSELHPLFLAAGIHVRQAHPVGSRSRPFAEREVRSPHVIVRQLERQTFTEHRRQYHRKGPIVFVHVEKRTFAIGLFDHTADRRNPTPNAVL